MGLPDKQLNNNAQPKGMGLDKKNKGRGGRGKGVEGRSPEGVKDLSQGASKASKGAANAGQGASRVASGDMSGVKDVGKGVKDTYDGAKQMGQGAKQMKNDLSSSGKPDPSKNSANEFTPQQLQNYRDNAYDPNSYESLFKDDDLVGDSAMDKLNGKNSGENAGERSDDKKDSDDTDDKDKDSKDDKDKEDGEGIKDLMDGDDSDSDGMDDIADLLQPNEGGGMDIKDMKQKAEVAGAAAGGIAANSAIQAIKMFLKWLQAMAAQAVAAVTGVWASIVATAQAVVSTLMAVTGLSYVVSVAVTVATAVVATGAVTIGLVAGIGSSNEAKMEETLVTCQPNNTSVSAEVVDWAESGELSAMKQETIEKSWSVFSEMGIPEEVAAGILGNFSAESSFDPTTVEAIGGQSYQYDSVKQNAEAKDFEAAVLVPQYKEDFPNVNQLGIGIAQWSNGRNYTLRDYASERGLKWYDIGTQLAFIFDGDNPGDVDVLWDIANTDGITVTEATHRFMYEWERPSQDALNIPGREKEAARIFLDMETMEVDTEYAQSIISKMNIDTAVANSNRSGYLQDDGCGDEVRSHYKQTLDGTGVFPEGVDGTMWRPDNLPSEVKLFTYDPANAGMGYGVSTGWIQNGWPGQCVAFADSYMENLYGVPRPGGANGGDVAKVWAEKYSSTLGGQLSDVPSAGAVFSNMNPGVYGHTGVVQHVFANGDILVVEQNINGISGDNYSSIQSLPYTWGWRYIPAAKYQLDDMYTWDWVFYKPDVEPNWGN